MGRVGGGGRKKRKKKKKVWPLRGSLTTYDSSLAWAHPPPAGRPNSSASLSVRDTEQDFGRLCFHSLVPCGCCLHGCRTGSHPPNTHLLPSHPSLVHPPFLLYLFYLRSPQRPRPIRPLYRQVSRVVWASPCPWYKKKKHSVAGDRVGPFFSRQKEGGARGRGVRGFNSCAVKRREKDWQQRRRFRDGVQGVRTLLVTTVRPGQFVLNVNKDQVLHIPPHVHGPVLCFTCDKQRLWMQEVISNVWFLIISHERAAE